MSHTDGPDFLPAEGQLDMFGAPPAPPDLDEVRAEIDDILAKVRATPRDSLGGEDTSHFRNIFSRMVGALPADEAEQLRQDLETELARLQAA